MLEESRSDSQPLPPPPLDFTFQSSEAPSDLRCRAPSTHPQNSTSWWQKNAGFWIRKGITGTDGFMGYLFFTVKEKKKRFAIFQITVFQMLGFLLEEGNSADESAFNPICDSSEKRLRKRVRRASSHRSGDASSSSLGVYGRWGRWGEVCLARLNFRWKLHSDNSSWVLGLRKYAKVLLSHWKMDNGVKMCL